MLAEKDFSHIMYEALFQFMYLENLKTQMFEGRNIDKPVFLSSPPALIK